MIQLGKAAVLKKLALFEAAYSLLQFGPISATLYHYIEVSGFYIFDVYYVFNIYVYST
jgi:hypothetical protein